MRHAFGQKDRILSFFERFTENNLNFLCTFPILPTGVFESAKNRFKFGLLFPLYWTKGSKSRKCHLSHCNAFYLFAILFQIKAFHILRRCLLFHFELLGRTAAHLLQESRWFWSKKSYQKPFFFGTIERGNLMSYKMFLFLFSAMFPIGTTLSFFMVIL